jgi:cell division protein FtsB
LLSFIVKKDFFGIACAAYVFILLLFSIWGDRGLLTSQSLWQQKKRLQQNIQDLNRDIQQMQEQVYRFSNDPITIEGYARQQLGMHRDNEIEIVLP